MMTKDVGYAIIGVDLTEVFLMSGRLILLVSAHSLFREVLLRLLAD